MQKTLLHFTKKLSGIFEGEQKGEQIQFTVLYKTVKPLDTTGVSAPKIEIIPFCDIIFCNEVSYGI